MPKPPSPMPIMAWVLVVLLFFFNGIAGYAVSNPDDSLSLANTTSMFHNFSVNAHPPDNDHDREDLGWIRRWAAIGDSYTAGIGSGERWMSDYTTGKTDYECSRYDKSYVGYLHRAFGPSAEFFQYQACSGAQTGEILQQAKDIQGNLDLVVLTAGGNDLCLTDIIKACIMLPYMKSRSCEDALKIAEGNVRKVLKPNVKAILNELNNKMSDNSVVVLSGYAQFFYVNDDDPIKSDWCTHNQDWTFPKSGLYGMYNLDVHKRERFNNLVKATNHIYTEILREINLSKKMKYVLRFADWDSWPQDKLVAGQFCWPDTTGHVPDPLQPRLQFFKPDTHADKTELKKRSIEAVENETVSIDNEVAWYSSAYDKIVDWTVNPLVEVVARLTRRDEIVPPKCPSDDRFGFDIGIPDAIGKFFHPNPMGHRTMASFILHEIVEARWEMTHPNPFCDKAEEFHCNEHKNGNEFRYTSAAILDKTYQTYCKELRRYENPGWSDRRSFYEGTPEEHSYMVTAPKSTNLFSETQCLDAFKHLIYSCDVNTKLGHKHGGFWRKGEFSYTLETGVSHKRPAVDEKRGVCYCDPGHFQGHMTIKGGGWGTEEHGKALEEETKRCIGAGNVWGWKFRYYEASEVDGGRPDYGIEWVATFNAPLAKLTKCFGHGEVIEKVGGVAHSRDRDHSCDFRR